MWAYYLSAENTLSVRNLEYSWAGFSDAANIEELAPYHGKFFEVILNVYDTKAKEFANDFYQYLLPTFAEPEELISKLNALQKGLHEKYVFLNKYIFESVDDIKRKQRAHACFMRRAPLAIAATVAKTA